MIEKIIAQELIQLGSIILYVSMSTYVCLPHQSRIYPTPIGARPGLSVVHGMPVKDVRAVGKNHIFSTRPPIGYLSTHT